MARDAVVNLEWTKWKKDATPRVEPPAYAADTTDQVLKAGIPVERVEDIDVHQYQQPFVLRVRLLLARDRFV